LYKLHIFFTFFTIRKAAWYIILVVSTVCVFVCLSVRRALSKVLTQEVHIAHRVYLQRLRVRFIYEDHLVKVKVTPVY